MLKYNIIFITFGVIEKRVFGFHLLLSFFRHFTISRHPVGHMGAFRKILLSVIITTCLRETHSVRL